MDTLKVIPLGGVEEIGINCTVFEYQERIVVVDMGLGFPDANMYGIDYLVPNISYLEQNKHKIEGIVITHGHLDHIGALPYLLPKLDFPEILATPFTLELIKAKMEEFGHVPKLKLRTINPDSVMAAGNFKLSFFRVNHSIPQCVGVVITTPVARVVHTGDFKFDNSPINEPVADYARIAQIGESGVDLMLADSTNSLRKGHPISESDVSDVLTDIVERAPGRIIIASFSGLVGRLYQLIKVAEQQKRKVGIAGYSMRQTLRIAEEIGYIKPNKGVLVPIQTVNRFNPEKVMILTTGAQGESNAALSKMASDEGYKNIKLKKGDTVVISAGTIPGNNVAVQALIDSITSQGAIVHQSESMDFFTSGHGYQEDQKIMLNLVKPKFFMPVHGYQYFLRTHARTAVQVGVKESNIVIAKRGSIIEGNRQIGFKETGRIKCSPILVSGSGVGDVGASVLAERHQIGNYGVVIVSALVDKHKRALMNEPQVFTRGFVYVKESGDIIAEIGNIAHKEILRSMKQGVSLKQLKEEIEKKVTRFVQGEIEREPAVITIINVVGEDGQARTTPDQPSPERDNRNSRDRRPRPRRPHTKADNRTPAAPKPPVPPTPQTVYQSLHRD